MSNIDKQALIAKIKKQTESYDTVVLRKDEANALLDELEAKDRMVAEPVHQVLIGDAWVDLSKGAMDSQKRAGAIVRTVYTAPPAPVSVPDDVMAAMQKVARIRLDLNDFDGDKRGILDCLGDAEEALIEVVNRRAAMLQGAEPVMTAYKLPEGWVAVPVEPTEGMLSAAGVNVILSDDEALIAYKAMLAAAPQREVKNG